MTKISWSTSLAILLAGVSGCAVNAEEHAVVESRSLGAIGQEPAPETALSCGQSPTSITYWASSWQLEIMDADGVIGGCEFDASCLPSCWGATSNLTSWAGPLFECPCRAL